jgi:hypothetical protein
MGWYPGDWVWPVLLAAVLAAVAGAGASLWVARSNEAASSTIVGTSKAQVVPPAPSAPEQAPPPSTRPPVTAPPPAPTPPALSGPISWPTGRSGWTVVLASIPATNGRADALARARQALRAGLTQVGVLESSSYSSLHPGYLVVFAGVYSSEDDARRGESVAHSHGYPGAYRRPITP